MVADSIPAFSTCLFHLVPRVLGVAADEKTVPVELYNRKKNGINCFHGKCGHECDYWIALMCYKFDFNFNKNIIHYNFLLNRFRQRQ